MFINEQFYESFNTIFMGNIKKKKNVYSTPAKAWESADVARSEPYTWNGCEQWKGKRWLQGSILSPCQGRDCLRKEVRYASNMVLKHSQKGHSDLLRSATIETPLIG